MSAPSPLFATLAGMLQTATQRLYALDLPGADDMPASRVWCRQRNAVVQAIIAEPPVTVADALIVLSCLSERRDLLDGEGADISDRDRRDLDEATTIALINVNAVFGAKLASQEHHTDDFRETMYWVGAQTERWLPHPVESVA